jgi:hypothetical protein
MREKLELWLSGLTLDPRTSVLADLVLELAADYERTRNTSTAEAIRKNIMEISRVNDIPEPEVDPLAELIKRHRG